VSYHLKPGLKNRIVKVVGDNDIASFLGSGGVDVLATPTMITWMEECARLLVEKYLNKNETTVGIHVDVYHKAAAPKGTKVFIEAELIEVKDRRLVFKVKAYSGEIVIGEGIHERYIVNLDKFKEKVKTLLKKMEVI